MGDRILLAHGDGGLLTHRLVRDLFLKGYGGPRLREQGDAAILDPVPRMALTTDSFVVSPIFFPGGDIGKLAVTGTVNDLAVSGAVPRYLTAGFILEEGLEIARLARVVESMAATARDCQVEIVAGDTKVVGRGQADGLYINTSGVGFVLPGTDLRYDRIRGGDAVIINGSVGEHGLAVLSRREGLEFETPIVSDCAPLSGLIGPLLERFPGIRFMRDPTRGGVATTLKEIALSAGVDIVLKEAAIPVTDAASAAAEMLGLDPLYLANEGKVLVIAPEEDAAGILEFMRAHPLGRAAGIIGRVEGPAGAGAQPLLVAGTDALGGSGWCGRVYLRTVYGGTKQLDMLAGEQLPRIC